MMELMSICHDNVCISQLLGLLNHSFLQRSCSLEDVWGELASKSLIPGREGTVFQVLLMQGGGQTLGSDCGG